MLQETCLEVITVDVEAFDGLVDRPSEEILTLLLVLERRVLDETFRGRDMHIHLVRGICIFQHLVNGKVDEDIPVLVLRQLDV